MKLNPDCVRDILLYCEAETAPQKVVSLSPYEMAQTLGDGKKYSEDEIMYHLSQCNMSGFFVKFSKDIYGNCSIIDISPKAHSFLANIHEDTIWNSVKTVAGKIGTRSLDAIVQIASNVVTELIKVQLGLTSLP